MLIDGSAEGGMPCSARDGALIVSFPYYNLLGDLDVPPPGPAGQSGQCRLAGAGRLVVAE
jgi:hypothetical protein